MQPPQLLFDAPASFIKVRRAFRRVQFFLACLIDRLNPLGHLVARFHDRPFAHHLAVQILEDLGGALQGYMMLLVEIHHLRFDPFPILHRLADLWRKFAHSGLMADRTFFDLGLMLGHFHLYRWHIKYLALFVAWLPLLQRSLAMTAAFYRMDFDVIGLTHSFERASRMSRLPTAFLTTLMPQAFGFLFQPIAGRWFSAVAAVFCHLVFQFLDAFCHF